VTEWF